MLAIVLFELRRGQRHPSYRQSDKVSWACIFPATALRGP
jgi:hypothetical protein